jgi:hypothetical protein
MSTIVKTLGPPPENEPEIQKEAKEGYPRHIGTSFQEEMLLAQKQDVLGTDAVITYVSRVSCVLADASYFMTRRGILTSIVVPMPGSE